MLADPDGAQLLEAVAQFLEADVRGAVNDPRVSFRTLIAAHICRGVAAEMKQAETHEAAELLRLAALFPAEAKDAGAIKDSATRRRTIAELNKVLIRHLKRGDSDRALLDHLRQTLRDELTLTNPRFDLAKEIE